VAKHRVTSSPFSAIKYLGDQVSYQVADAAALAVFNSTGERSLFISAETRFIFLSILRKKKKEINLPCQI